MKMERMISWLPAAHLQTPGCDHNDDDTDSDNDDNNDNDDDKDKDEEKKDFDEKHDDRGIDDCQFWAQHWVIIVTIYHCQSQIIVIMIMIMILVIVMTTMNIVIIVMFLWPVTLLVATPLAARKYTMVTDRAASLSS